MTPYSVGPIYRVLPVSSGGEAAGTWISRGRTSAKKPSAWRVHLHMAPDQKAVITIAKLRDQSLGNSLGNHASIVTTEVSCQCHVSCDELREMVNKT